MSLKRQWWEWHKKNPKVFELFCTYTYELINAGHTHYSAKGIWERIRWHTHGDTKGDDFKLQNNHTAYYARYFMHLYPEHKGFFRTREVKEDGKQRVKHETM